MLDALRQHCQCKGPLNRWRGWRCRPCVPEHVARQCVSSSGQWPATGLLCADATHILWFCAIFMLFFFFFYTSTLITVAAYRLFPRMHNFCFAVRFFFSCILVCGTSFCPYLDCKAVITGSLHPLWIWEHFCITLHMLERGKFSSDQRFNNVPLNDGNFTSFLQKNHFLWEILRIFLRLQLYQ